MTQIIAGFVKIEMAAQVAKFLNNILQSIKNEIENIFLTIIKKFVIIFI
jgi:hypothetical protein